MKASKVIEIKICGMTSVDDVNAAIEMGADYVGFVMYPRSPRRISAMMVARILDRTRNAQGRAVGVFINEPRKHVEQVARDLKLRAVQLHGDEDTEEFRDMPVPVWRSVSAIDEELLPDPGEWDVERYVFDAPGLGRYGGTGRKADWKKAAAFARRNPVMLAGGLRPENVADAISVVAPAGIDVSSGVELKPGVKDHRKMKAFIDNARRSLET